MKVSIGRYPKKIGAERKISVKIDPWDIWSMDHTLALIIHPMLVKLKEEKHGAPNVDDEDVPEMIHSNVSPGKNSWDIDGHHFDRWDWVIDEMIWAFAQILDEDAERQFHTGKIDVDWEEVDVNGEKLYEMVKGPNDTHVFDREGWEVWNERKANGFRLFGKYYQALWD